MSVDGLPVLDAGVDLLSDNTNLSDVLEDTLNPLTLENFTTQVTTTVTTSNVLNDTDFSIWESVTTTLENVLRQSNVDDLLFGSDKVTTDDFLPVNNSQTEVTIRRPEVLGDPGIGTAEKVVIGAAIIVACFTILAIILRVCMPVYRKRGKQEQCDKTIYNDDLDDNVISGYTNIALEISSQSSGNSHSNSTGSNPSTDWSQSSGSNSSSDWSEVASEQTKSTTYSKNESETNMADRYHRHPGNMTLPSNYKSGSTTSLPLYIHQERLPKSAKSSPIPYRKSPNDSRKFNDETVSVISAKSLEPVRMEEIYRNRWDDQWDPYGSIPRGNLSHHSHPSESRLSLNSYSSHNSSVTFPIPSRKIVHKMSADQDRRYPSNIRTMPTQFAKKEKHVRLTPPTDRREYGPFAGK